MKSENSFEEYSFEVIWLNGLKEKGKVYKDGEDVWKIRNLHNKNSSKYNGKNKNKNKK